MDHNFVVMQSDGNIALIPRKGVVKGELNHQGAVSTF